MPSHTCRSASTPCLIVSGTRGFELPPSRPKCSVDADVTRLVGLEQLAIRGGHVFARGGELVFRVVGIVGARASQYTDWASRQIFMENKIGTIEAGKYADLAIWNKDVYAVPAAELKDMQCSMTIFNGKVVHER